MSRFSIVIPTFNRASLLVKTLESVLQQEYRDFEVIVVDDGSTDDTVHAVGPYRDRINFIQQANQGPGAARNRGARMAVGEYVAFLDSDDYWFPWTLATYAQIIDETNEPNLVRGALWYFSDEAAVAGIRPEAPVAERYPDFYAAGRNGIYCGSGQMAVRRLAFLGVGGFAEGRFNAEDHDLAMRLGTAPGFVNVTAPAMIAYRQHDAAATRDLAKTYVGSMHLVEMEKAGRYPGGTDRRWDRWQILSSHIRPLTLELLRQKERSKACSLYRHTFFWNLSLRRFRYLTGFLVKAAITF